jgi:hypothetical protein
MLGRTRRPYNIDMHKHMLSTLPRRLTAGLCAGVIFTQLAACRLASRGELGELLDSDDAELVGGFYNGRYAGMLNVPAGRLTAGLDLIVTHGSADDIQKAGWRALLKVAPGGFNSHEYTTFDFSGVGFTGDGSLSLKATNGDELVLTKPAEQVVRGTLKRGGVTTPLEMSRVRPTSATLATAAPTAKPAVDEEGNKVPLAPLIEPLTGYYVGNCADGVASLQVEAVKWPRGDVPGGYRLAGRTGYRDDVACGPLASGQLCIKENFNAGEYDVLGGAVTLKAGYAARQCNVTAAAVQCSDCELKKDTISPHAALDVEREVKVFRRSEHLPPVAASDDGAKPVAMAGQYYGYVHHENRDAYQLLALNVKESGADKVATVATLYFGEGDSTEFIAYRFGDTAIKRETPQRAVGPFVLDGGGEAFLVISDWHAGRIMGTWFSKSFGRVGTVELQRDIVPELSNATQIVEPIAGHYKGDEWDFEIAATANLSETASEFYPIKVYGWAREKVANSRRRTIEEVAYDFYSGAVALRLDDGRHILGRVSPNGMDLHWLAKPRLGAPLATAKTHVFRRFEDNVRHVRATKQTDRP